MDLTVTVNAKAFAHHTPTIGERRMKAMTNEAYLNLILKYNLNKKFIEDPKKRTVKRFVEDYAKELKTIWIPLAMQICDFVPFVFEDFLRDYAEVKKFEKRMRKKM